MTEAPAVAEAFIFLHVPKSAGTTLNRLIEWEYHLFEMYSVDPVFYRRWRRETASTSRSTSAQ